ncbi:homocysteine S-methyltransferase family protein [Oceanotoga sp. DSM 15011]|uniref:homocysteine S-methyltransferase family protein n=1 Tax=Oceanotoga sp. DSM 15011 TaxID=2984951 RepID=UPI0021F4285C|nr:homocysteine S-methyltransferase family protein [Oceanotoga sp. DSM 15011]UYP00280.1 homocysteine S-methyltransferase family protein [Oceanotoga sp. DSM 15011]
MNLSNLLNKKFILFDGAMGSMIQKENINTLPELLNLENPNLIRSIHKKYIEAGADIITTNTFGANNHKLKKYNVDSDLIIKNAIEIAKSVQKNNLIALDIGPIGRMIEPMGKMTFDESYEFFKKQVIAGEKYGADLILFETFSDIYELKSGILSAKENTKLPIFATMTFSDDKRTFTGTDIKTMISVLEGLNVNALGINCSLGPDKMGSLVDKLVKYSSTPIIVQANAGLPDYKNGNTIYNINSNEYNEHTKKLMNKGIQIIGGCCGTTDEYIRKLNNSRKQIPFKPVFDKNYSFISSYSKTYDVSKNIHIIGERINPTGKKKLRQAIIEENMEYITNLALKQKEEGAEILDVNMGVPKIDENKLMIKSIKEIQKLIDIPLQIDSTNIEVIDNGLRYYNGKAIINSVNGKKNSMEEIFPVIKKYGAMVICLTLNEDGIPETMEKRLQIAKNIENTALKYGISKKDLIFDFLVLAVSAQQNELYNTLSTLSYVKNTYNYNTTLGVSNVSFGLPNRKILNRTFLAMALQAGLNLPIINTSSQDMMDTINSYKVLANIDKDCKKYISIYSEQKEEELKNETLEYCIENGLKEKTKIITIEKLKNTDPLEIINNILIPTLNKVGDKYEKEIIFLPQLIQSAETAKIVFKEIKNKLPDLDSSNKKDKIILATVEGDIHDIGKNIVKVILENYGYEIIDLGKDVACNKIIEKIQDSKAKIVGLSALMTTTLINMENTVKEIRKKFDDIKIIIGGAVVTKTFANSIGADFYAKDAREALKYLEKVPLN